MLLSKRFKDGWQPLRTNTDIALSNGCRFVVLVSGTLVYSRGDEKEALREAGLADPAGAPEEEGLMAPPGSLPVGIAPSAAGTAPISMRQTPHSFKVRTHACLDPMGSRF